MADEFHTIEFNPPLEISGDGSSLWAGEKWQGAVRSQSRGTFHVSKATLEYSDFASIGAPGEGCWEMECFGEDTKWFHYTDDLVEKEVLAKVVPAFLKFGRKVTKLGWSEQGKQPRKGWNFDCEVERVPNEE